MKCIETANYSSFIYDVNKQETVFWYYCVVTNILDTGYFIIQPQENTQKTVIISGQRKFIFRFSSKFWGGVGGFTLFFIFHFRVSKLTVWGTSRDPLNFL